MTPERNPLAAAMLRGVAWSVDRAVRVIAFFGVLWLLPDPREEAVRLTDATTNDLAAALVAPVLLAIFFYHLMGDRK